MLNGKGHGTHVPLDVREGERVEITFSDQTTMAHPMHLHRHRFQVVAINGERFAGAVRDTVLVPARGSVTVAFDANNQYSVGSAIRVGRALEELGYIWFEEPVQHYDVRGMGEVAQRLDITVSAAEQTYTIQALVDMINAGVRMVQPDIVKMGGITGLMHCAAICFAHGVELVPHQTQPAIGNVANLHVLATLMHLTKPAEFADASGRLDIGFTALPKPENGRFHVPAAPGLGIEINDAEIAKRVI